VDGRHVIEALKIIRSRMGLTLEAWQCRQRECLYFLIGQKVGRMSPHSMLSTQEATRKATILVVDDSPDMLRYLRMVLELDSYRVETANNGVEALQRVRSGTVPEVVVLDLQMPGLDGVKTLGRLLKLQPKLKVIMCSGVDDPVQVQQAALLGARAYLKKPVKHLYLSAAVKECLGLGPDIQIGNNGAELISLPPPPQYSEN